MLVEFAMPELGLGEEPVMVSLWLVDVGGTFAAGDRLLELSADGVTVDLPAPGLANLQTTAAWTLTTNPVEATPVLSSAGQMNWFGNLHPGILMIDAKPIPGSDKIVAIFSPGHGQREHAGEIVVVDPNAGPDEQSAARSVAKGKQFRDPWAFSEECFMAWRPLPWERCLLVRSCR